MKEKCFAEVKGSCRILNEKQCENCSFYKTKQEYEMLKIKYPPKN